MTNSTTSAALNLTILTQTDTFTQGQQIQCISEDEDHTLILTKTNSLTNIVYLYEISDTNIVTNSIPLTVSFESVSCIIVNEVSKYVIYLLVKSPKQALYRILIDSPIEQKQAQTQMLKEDRILQIGYIGSTGQLVEVYASKIAIFNSTWEQQGETYESPHIQVIDSDSILIYTYQLCGLISSVDRKTQYTKQYYLDNQQQYACSGLLFDKSNSIIGISVFNVTSNAYSNQYFLTKNLEQITYFQKFRFLKFSQFQNNAMFIVDGQQVCYSLFSLQSSTLSIQTQACYLSQTDLSKFQEIIINDEQYFFNGTHLFHKSYDQAQDDPTLYYPNRYLGDNQTLFNQNTALISMPANKILLLTSNAFYLLSPEIVDVQNSESSQQFSVGAIIGIIAGAIIITVLVILLIIFCRPKKQQNDNDLKTQPTAETIVHPPSVKEQENIQEKHKKCSLPRQSCICSESDPIFILACKHIFHVKCITMWLKTNNKTCPKCGISISNEVKSYLI